MVLGQLKRKNISQSPLQSIIINGLVSPACDPGGSQSEAGLGEKQETPPKSLLIKLQ
jgi:hypothetical protein